jgi:hypothetical protein
MSWERMMLELISPFYKGLIIGIFIGANLGLLVIGLCIAAKRR